MRRIKRKWYQIHLSTACLVMVMTAGALGLNLESQTAHSDIAVDYFLKAEGYSPIYETKDIKYYGWPFRIWSQELEWDLVKKDLKRDIKNYSDVTPLNEFIDPYVSIARFRGHWKWSGIMANMALLLIFLFALMVFCEYLIRRRKSGSKEHQA